jgi:hypothetical protein
LLCIACFLVGSLCLAWGQVPTLAIASLNLLLCLSRSFISSFFFLHYGFVEH